MAEKAKKEKKAKESIKSTQNGGSKKAAVLTKPKKTLAGSPPLLEEKLKKTHLEDARVLIKDVIDNYKKDLDPEKLDLLKAETRKIFKRGAVFLLVIIATASLLILPEVYLNRKVQANTFIGDMDVSTMPTDAAKEKLILEINQYIKKPITFQLGEQKASLSPEELSIHYLTDKIISRLPVVNLATANTFQMVGMLIAKTVVPAQYSYDEFNIVGKLEGKFDLAQKRAHDAKIIFKDDNFIVEPEVPGSKIDEQKLFTALNENLKNLRTDTINLTLVPESPRITAIKLSEQKDQIVNSLKKEITIGVGKKTLKFKPIEHLDFITFAEKTEVRMAGSLSSLPIDNQQKYDTPAKNSSLTIVTGLKPEVITQNIEPFLRENLLKDIEVPTSGVTITRKEDGSITIEGKGEDGKTVSIKNLAAAINLAMASTASYVPVPVRTEKAPVNIAKDLQNLGIKELIVTGHTSYYGSPPNRMHNIDTGIKKYNGIIVAPGEEFSFNTILGEVDAKNGYLPEKVIKKNKIEVEYGGGICQVSTTLYRAALLGGFPIIERNPHSWKVSYYGQVLGDGLDATIYLGVSDVKFINDSPGHLLIQAYTDGANAYFKFYGTSDGRTVALQGPYGGGLNFKWYRILKKNGEETKETITSNYKPIPPPDPPAAKPVAAAPAPTPVPDKPTL